MVTIARVKAELRAIKRLPPGVQRNIKENIRRGLLCACNKVRVPYFGDELDDHGSLVSDGVKHGYTDCDKLPASSQT